MNSQPSKFNIGVSVYIAVILSVASFFLGRYILNQDRINERQQKLNEKTIENITKISSTLNNLVERCETYDRWWEDKDEYDREQDKQIYRLDRDVSVIKSKTNIN